MALNARLRAVADYVCGGALVVDVGCDHAILPIELVRENRVKRVIACDIGEGPLSTARRNIERAGLSDVIETRLSDGLKKISPDEADHIVIAGMGGNLISDIIGAVEWTKSEKYRFILQPMTSADDLRAWLCENGFYIESETPVYDAKRLYTVMLCRYDGIRRDMPPEYRYIGEISVATKEGRDLICRQIRSMERRLSSLDNAKHDHPETDELKAILTAMKERLEKSNADIKGNL